MSSQRRISHTRSFSKTTTAYPDVTRRRKIRALVSLRVHGAQNVPAKQDDMAVLYWRRGSKKHNSGNTAPVEVIFGMATWKHSVDLDVTFMQDKTSKAVEEKTLFLALKAGRGAARAFRPSLVGSRSLDLSEFHDDGTHVERIVPLNEGNNPVTLKLTVETRWTHIDNKEIVRGSGSESDYDLKTVTFDSEDELSVAGDLYDFSVDDEAAMPIADQSERVAELEREVQTLTAVLEQAKGDVRRGEEKLNSYRAALQTKKDQAADMRRVLEECEKQNAADRDAFERELRELRRDGHNALVSERKDRRKAEKHLRHAMRKLKGATREEEEEVDAPVALQEAALQEQLREVASRQEELREAAAQQGEALKALRAQTAKKLAMGRAAEETRDALRKSEAEVVRIEKCLRSAERAALVARNAAAEADLRATEAEARLECERREHKLLIQHVLLGSAKSAGAVCESLRAWASLEEGGAETTLNKLSSAYVVLLSAEEHSYAHCLRVLSQLCALRHALRVDVELEEANDPNTEGVREGRGAPQEASAVETFCARLELATERAFVAASVAVFARLEPYLAPAVLNHAPAEHASRIEETVVESGHERGKFMAHTILSTLNDVRAWLERCAVPAVVARQLMRTVMRNVNAYLFQYLIQTPVICAPNNAFTIKTRLALVGDWFAQEANAGFSGAFRELAPVSEAAMLLFVDRASLRSWDNVHALCPSLNVLQILSLVEMMQVDETQSQTLADEVRAEVNERVDRVQGGLSLFFHPVSVVMLDAG